jgi:hypothetical protein
MLGFSCFSFKSYINVTNFLMFLHKLKIYILWKFVIKNKYNEDKIIKNTSKAL